MRKVIVAVVVVLVLATVTILAELPYRIGDEGRGVARFKSNKSDGTWNIEINVRTEGVEGMTLYFSGATLDDVEQFNVVEQRIGR
jgi:hypothetical protein